MDKVQIHKDIVNGMNDLYRAKNNDYGDSFAILRQRHHDAILIRLWDKLLRLDRLMGGGNQMVSESIDDTLTDLANYAIMELIERRVDRKENPVNQDTINTIFARMEDDLK